MHANVIHIHHLRENTGFIGAAGPRPADGDIDDQIKILIVGRGKDRILFAGGKLFIDRME